VGSTLKEVKQFGSIVQESKTQLCPWPGKAALWTPGSDTPPAKASMPS